MANKLKSIRLGFGETKNAPTTLTEGQIETLMRVIEDDTIETKLFRGFITSSNGIKGSMAWILGSNGISYVGTLLVDGYTVSADTDAVNEGATVNFSAEGVPLTALSFTVETIGVSGEVTEDEVRSILSIKDNVLTVGKLSKMNDWTATVIIKSKPRYESSETHNIPLTVIGRALPTAITIGGQKHITGKFGETLTADLSIIYNRTPRESDILDVEYICDNQYITISNKTYQGFTLSAQSVATSAKLTVKVHYSGRVLETTADIDFALVPDVGIGGSVFSAVNGEGEQRFIFDMTPHSVPVSALSVVTNDANILARDIDLTGFTLYSTGFAEVNKTVTVTATLAIDGTTKVVTKDIVASNKEVILTFSLYKENAWIEDDQVVKVGNLYPQYLGRGYWRISRDIAKELPAQITIDNVAFAEFTGEEEIYSDSSADKTLTMSPHIIQITDTYYRIWYTPDLSDLYVKKIEISGINQFGNEFEVTLNEVKKLTKLTGSIISFSESIILPKKIPSSSNCAVAFYSKEYTSYGLRTCTVYYIVKEYVPRPYEAIDLGLPSGVKWASCNIGANEPEESGLYFQWGSTKGHTATEGYNFAGDNYPESGISADLSLTQDAANVIFGGSWRMPTEAEIDELVANTTPRAAQQNGIQGVKLASKINGNSIFLPLTGYCQNVQLISGGSVGYYWSAACLDDGTRAYCLRIQNNSVIKDQAGRIFGITIRAVR